MDTAEKKVIYYRLGQLLCERRPSSFISLLPDFFAGLAALPDDEGFVGEERTPLLEQMPGADSKYLCSIHIEVQSLHSPKQIIRWQWPGR
jgi:hypothetical protein